MTTANINVRQVLIKRGNTAAASSYVGPIGELVLDTGLETIRVQDGVTPGGNVLLPNQNVLNAAVANLQSQINTIDGNVITQNAVDAATNLSIIATNGIVSNLAANVEASIIALQANTAGLYTDILTNNANEVALGNAIVGSNAAIITANTGMQSYVNSQVTSLTSTIAVTNSAIVTANTALKSYVDTRIAMLANAPAILDTLGQIAANLQADESSIGTILNGQAAANVQISNLWSNAASQASSLLSLQSEVYGNSNVATYLTNSSGITLGSGTGAVVTQGVLNVTNGIAFPGYTGYQTRPFGGPDGTTIVANGTGYLSSTYGNANVASYLPAYTGNIAVSNINPAGQLAINLSQGPIHGTYNFSAAGLGIPGGMSTQSLLFGQSGNDATIEVNNSNITGNLVLGTNNAIYTWIFGNNGNLRLPTNGQIQFANGAPYSDGYGNTQVASYIAGTVTLGDITTGNIAFANTVGDISAGSLLILQNNTAGNVQIKPAGPGSTPFVFSGNTVRFPDNSVQSTAWTGFTNSLVNSGYTTFLDNSGILRLATSQYNNGQIQSPNNLPLLLGVGNTSAVWSFFGSGNMAFPDNSVQSTAWLGNSVVASYLSGSSLITGINANITAANSAIATLQSQVYSNVNTAGYLAGNITSGNITVGHMQFHSADNSITTDNGSGISVNSRVNIYGSAVNIGLYVSGNITGGQNSNATSFYGTNYLYPNGVSILSGIGGTYSNANVASYLPVYAGNILAGNITVGNYVTANAFVYGSQTTQVSSGGTLNLTNTSPQYQYFTANGYSGYTVVLPDPTTVQTNQSFVITNNAGGIVVVKNFSGTSLVSIPPGGITTFAFTSGTNWGWTSGVPNNFTFGTAGMIGTGNITITSNIAGSVRGAVLLTADSTYQAPNNPGVLLQVVGQTSNPSRVYVDGIGTGNYSAWIGRHYNGTTASPTQLLANDVITRFGGTPYSSTGWPTISTTRVDLVAEENQSGTNRGSGIQFWITPIGSTTIQKQLTVNTAGVSTTANISTTANFVGSGQYLTNLNYNSTGNITGTSSNVTLVAGSYSTIFDNTGNITLANVATTYINGPWNNGNIVINPLGPGSVIIDGNLSVVAGGYLSSTVAAATLSSTASSVGYQGLPQNSQSGGYTLVIGDAGKHIYSSATQTVTIPANASVAFPIGTVVTFISGTGATTTIAITSDTMYLAGSGTTGSRTLAAYGMATAVKVTSTSWYINGTGLT